MNALTQVEDEMNLFPKRGNHRGLAGCAALKFLAHNSLADHSNEALEEGQNGINLFRELGDTKGEADMWLNVSGVHFSSKMYDEVLHEAQEALMLYRDIKDKTGMETANFIL